MKKKVEPKDLKVEYHPDFWKSVNKMIWRERLEPINPKEYWRKLKAYHQRGKRGWSNSDVWGLHSHLSEVIAGMVRHLKDNHWGYPNNPFHPTNMTSKKWEKILEDIALGFESFEKLNYDIGLHPKSGEYKKLLKQWNRGHKLFIQYYANLWD